MVPEGAEVHSGKSNTIEDLGSSRCENEQVRARLGVDTKLNKLLVFYGE